MSSSVSLWEITIKLALDRPDFSVDGEQLRSACLAAGYLELPVTGLHALEVRKLPPLHRDPFDRMLVAQSWIEGLTRLTVDAEFLSYDERIEEVRPL